MNDCQLAKVVVYASQCVRSAPELKLFKLARGLLEGSK